MLNLGLGLGLTKNAGGGAVPVSIALSGSPETTYDTLGYAGPTGFDFISNDTILEGNRLRLVGAQAEARTINFKTIGVDGYPDAGSPINLPDADAGTFYTVEYMGNNRALILGAGGAIANGNYIYLIDTTSGDILDTYDLTTIAGSTVNNGASIRKYDSTRAVLCFLSGGTSYDANVAVLDITGDTIEAGTAHDTGYSVSTGDKSYFGACILDDYIAVAIRGRVQALTLLGTTLTLVHEAYIGFAGLNDTIEKNTGNRFVVVNENSNLTQVYAGDVTSDIVSLGSAVQQGDSGFFTGPANAGLVTVKDDNLYFMSTFLDTLPNEVHALPITVSENTVSLGEFVYIMDGDHPTVRKIPGTKNLLVVSQSGTAVASTNYVMYQVVSVSGISAFPSVTNNLSLDAPVSASMVSSGDGLYAWGFDRWVSGYSGDTVRLERLSDNAEADFGFNENGYFDIIGVNAWRNGADVDVVKFYNQTGTTADLTAVGTAKFIVSDVPFRFGCDYDEDTGLLTRTANKGGYGVNTEGTGHFETGGLTVDVANDGVELFALSSNNTRKARVPGDDTVSPAGNNTSEKIMAYGSTTGSSFLRFYYNGTFGTYLRFTSATGSVNNGAQSFQYTNQYAQMVNNLQLTPTSFDARQNFVAVEDNPTTLAAGYQTDIANGDLDNGKLFFGTYFSGSSGDTSGRHNAVFGGGIVTKNLSAKDNYLVTSKIGLIGQQHLNAVQSDVEALWDEMIFLKDMNTGTGVAAGMNSQVEFQWNTGTNAAGTSTTIFDHEDSYLGLQGVRTPDENFANGFIANNNYFAGKTTGTLLSFYRNDDQANDLVNVIALGEDTGFGEDSASLALAMGTDHNEMCVETRFATSRDANSIFRNRKDEFGQELGDDRASGASNGMQPMGKYNNKTPHTQLDFGQTFDVVAQDDPLFVWDEAAWANENPAQPYLWDAPVRRPLNQDREFRFKDLYPVMHFMTFKPNNPDYDRADDQATRDVDALNGTTKSYVGIQGAPIGHNVGDVAVNANAGIVDSADTAKLHASHDSTPFVGTRFAFAFLPDTVLTQDEINKTHMNFYKFFEE